MNGPYICHNCGEIFDEPRVYPEYHGFDDFPEIWSCCPYCDGDYGPYEEPEEPDDEEVDDEE